MKKNFLFIFFVLFCLCCVFPVCAIDEKWEMDGTTLVKYSGDREYIVFPDNIKNIVRTIGDYAFHSNQNIRGIEIPAQVEVIGDDAFDNAKNLQVVTLASGSKLKSIGRMAFYSTSIETFTIPAGVTTLGYNVFGNCQKLRKITFNNTMAELPSSLFERCSSLVEVRLPYGPIELPTFTFWKCKKLQTVYIPETYTISGTGPFLDCDSLDHVVFQGSRSSIPECLFQSCTGPLSNIEWGGASVIERMAFYDASNMTSVTLPDGLTEIGFNAFEGTGLSTITIPESVRTINNYAFWNTNIRDINVPAGVTSLGSEFAEEGTHLTVKLGSEAYRIAKKYKRTYTYTLADGEVETTALSISGPSTMKYGESVRLTANFTPANVTYKNLEWKVKYSFYEDLISVDNMGNVTVLKNPDYDRTVAVEAKTTDWTDITATFSFKILKQTEQKEEIAITADSAEVTGGNKLQLTALPANVFWSSSNLAVAVVDSNGLVTTKAVQDKQVVTITATLKTDLTKKGTFTLAVLPKIAGIEIYQGTAQIQKTLEVDMSASNTLTLTAKVTPSDAAPIVTWSCSNPKVAEVDGSGKVTIHTIGKVNITATTTDGSKKSKTITLMIVSLVSDITLSGPNEVAIGKSISLTAAVGPDTATNKKLTWSVSNTNATVSNGKVTGKRAGIVNIKAKAIDGSEKEATMQITVKSAATSVAIFNGGFDVTKKTLNFDTSTSPLTLLLLAQVSPSYASQCVTWKSSNANVASVDANGLVSLQGNGKVTITAVAADGTNKSASVTLNITTTATQVEILNFAKENVTDSTIYIAEGKNISLTANVLPANTTNKKVIWESDNMPYVTVSNGKVNAKAGSYGKQAVITAKAQDGSAVFGSVTVVVSESAATGVEIHLDSRNISGTTQNLFVNGYPAGLNVTATTQPAKACQEVTWTSSNPTVASIENGKVTPLSTGKATITAFAIDGSGKKAYFTVNVKVLASEINLTGPAELSAGQSAVITVGFIPENVSSQVLIWNSDNANVTVKDGKVSVGKQAGHVNVKITAKTTDGSGLSKSWNITVHPLATAVSVTEYGQTTILNGETIELDTEGDPSEIHLASYASPEGSSQFLIWSSSNKKVANVDENGTVHALSKGSAQIRSVAQDGSKSYGYVNVNVVTKVSEVRINKPVSLWLAKGKTIKLTAEVLPSHATNKGISWSSANQNIAAVDKSGKLTAKAVGETTITVHASNGKTDSFEIHVTEPAVSIRIVDDNEKTLTGTMTLEVGQEYEIHSVISPNNAYQTATWKSSNPNVAQIDIDDSDNVTLQVLATGSAKITAGTVDGTNKLASFSVKAVPIAVATEWSEIAAADEFEVDLSAEVLMENISTEVETDEPEINNEIVEVIEPLTTETEEFIEVSNDNPVMETFEEPITDSNEEVIEGVSAETVDESVEEVLISEEPIEDSPLEEQIADETVLEESVEIQFIDEAIGEIIDQVEIGIGETLTLSAKIIGCSMNQLICISSDENTVLCEGPDISAVSEGSAVLKFYVSDIAEEPIGELDVLVLSVPAEESIENMIENPVEELFVESAVKPEEEFAKTNCEELPEVVTE